MQVSRRAPALLRLARPVRSAHNRVLSGTAGGVAETVGVDPALVRASFLVLSLAGGIGAFLYVLTWAASVPGAGRESVVKPLLSGARQVGAIACITGGLLVAARHAGLWLGDGVVWPVSLAALGVSVIWVRGDGALRGWTSETSPFSRSGLLRLGIGGVLVLIGMGSVLAANTTFTLRRALDLMLPLLVVLAGVALIVGPWLLALARQMTEERRERIRSQERSEMAAHLHDSVLQTLALIQRTSSGREMATLARVQERELRAWLYGKSKTLDVQTLDAAVDVLAGRVEKMHQVTVETVVVGDARLDDRLGALVHACGEAMINAARHSGEDSISVYVEVEEGRVTAYVRDQGRGFDPAAVAPDRRGIADSIVGRMHRFGGTAAISTAPGAGTEVHLVMPL
jgi:signal transduction histidine kinase